jgi:hypothetical protein
VVGARPWRLGERCWWQRIVDGWSAVMVNAFQHAGWSLMELSAESPTETENKDAMFDLIIVRKYKGIFLCQ